MLYSCSNDKDVKVTSGKDIYTQYCVACHGTDGKKGLANASDLSKSNLTQGQQKHIIINGKGSMTPFSYSLNNEQIDSVVVYIQELKTK